MSARDDDAELRSVALQNAQSILLARRRAEEALRKQSEWLRITLASIGDAVISTDVNGKVTFMNGVAQRLTGWPEAEALGRPLADVFRIINERTRQPVENPALRALREGAVVGLANHTLLVARDGSERPIDDSAAPIRDQGGSAIGAVLVFRDVSERKRAEEARARLAAIVESSDDAIISKALDSTILSWNAGAERIFGYSAQEAIGQSIVLIIPPERRDEEIAILERLRRGERIEHFETVRVAKDGRRLNLSITVSPVRDTDGHIIGASKIGRDITERRRAEDALRQSNERARLALDIARMGTWTWEPDSGKLTVDDRCREVSGLSSAQLLFLKDLMHLVHAEDAPRVNAALYAALHPQGTGLYAAEYRVMSPQGETRWLAARGQAIFEGQGAARHAATMVGVVQDITKHKQLEADLRVRAELLSQADRRKDEFIALLAHELRNPLAPLRNGLQVMRLSGEDQAAVAQARNMMERQLGHMVRLIDDLLDISRISQNKMELRRSRVALSDVISSGVETARPLIEAANHRLILALPPEPIYLDADLTRLAQVFSNLLTNSAKYTDAGGRISLLAERRGAHVQVAVSDTGIGIPAEALPRIFDMFSQVDRSIERSTGGLGIGLALVKALVEMHGGSVSAASAGLGKGSTFTVKLPLLSDDTAEVAVLPAEHQAAGTGRRILVVDDNRDAAVSLSLALRLMGNDVRSVHDGLEAIEAAERFQPQVILMDVGMPRLNGLEATRRIREAPWGRDILIVALTGWGQDADRVQSQEAGCDGHLVKPVSLTELETYLEELVEGRAKK